MSKAKPQVYRVCAVCGKRHAVTYGFARVLRWHGIKGDKAALSCIEKLKVKGQGLKTGSQ